MSNVRFLAAAFVIALFVYAAVVVAALMPYLAQLPR
jgi:hypothetical protein